MKLPNLAVRAIGALLLGGISFALLRTTSLIHLIPVPIPTWWLLIPAFFAFVPSLFPRGSPLPLTLSALLPIFLSASYDQSRLDWLRLLKDFELIGSSGPSWLRIGLGIAALAIAWAVHVADHALRLGDRSTERGISEAQARAARAMTLRAGGRRLGIALAGTVVLVGVSALVNLLALDRIVGTRSALVAPLLAAIILGGAAIALARGSLSANERQ